MKSKSISQKEKEIDVYFITSIAEENVLTQPTNSFNPAQKPP